eukprot:1159968-Pelagomonas_calceolata.AAC.12
MTHEAMHKATSLEKQAWHVKLHNLISLGACFEPKVWRLELFICVTFFCDISVLCTTWGCDNSSSSLAASSQSAFDSAGPTRGISNLNRRAIN